MIILDYSQVSLSNLLTQVNTVKGIVIDENLIRHMVLNSIRMYNVKFKAEYGDMVIACDDTHVWRKQVFPYYKANRKKDRESSKLDWNSIFQCLNKIRDELKEFFPYKVIQIPTAEADDIIASLVNEYGYKEPILIISGDKDFKQLHRYPRLKQYSPVLKKFIVEDNPEGYLKEQILRGDVSDGVPNFLSPDNTFILSTRQTRLSSTKMAEWIKAEPEEFCTTTMLRNFKRNQQLIDLSFIPKSISNDTLSEFNTQNKDRSKLFNYFIKYKLKNLMTNIQEF